MQIPSWALLPFLCLLPAVANGQQTTASLPDADIKQFSWRSIGPANMSGRITSIAVYAEDPSIWWAATASGGLLKTTNNGITFEHQFDREATVSIGDVQVSQSDPNIVWVGTGEGNPRNSASWGDGVYKSTDGGKTWKNMGLARIFQTGRIAIHPTDPNVVYVGALGRLWGSNEQRGLFKTNDGGATWEKVLYVDDKTGVIDVQMNPQKPDTLLVATYQRQRDGFDGNDPEKKFGPGAGIYRTTDGGKNFAKVSLGLPQVDMGRIGLSFYPQDPQHVYAIIETEKIGTAPAEFPFVGFSGASAEVGGKISAVTKDSSAEKAGLKVGDIVIDVDGVRILNFADLQKAIRQKAAGQQSNWEVVRQGETLKLEFTYGKRKEADDETEDRARTAARSPFSASLGGQLENLQGQQGPEESQYGGIYHSDDGGVTWTRINSLNPRPMYYSQIRVDPSDRKRIYVLGTSLYRSKDGGEHFTADGAGRGVHVDHHALWVDPADGRHMILGNDGGIYVTYDRMENWDHHNHVAIGQFYHVGISSDADYKVYGGLQDNGSWGGPSRVPDASGPMNSDWFSVAGGDGFVCLVDPADPNQIYYESQNGAMGRVHLETGQRGSIRPRAPEGTSYRFNWKTPFVLSPHNPQIHYSAGNYVFRSVSKGDKVKPISPEIARTDKGAGSAISESPRQEGVLYVGTTDGALWMTQDGGVTWTDLRSEESLKDRQAAETAAAEAKRKSQEKPSAEKADSESDEATPSEQSGDESPAAKETPASRPARNRRNSDEKAVDDGSRPLYELVKEPRWVSSLSASKYADGRCYLSLDGHRSNDDEVYLFVTENFGSTWKSIRGNLPTTAGPVRVLREDIDNANVLYLGCEFSIWVTIDRGESWTRLNSNLPTVAVHEFAQHPTRGEIVAGTHGRAIWIMDATALRQLSKERLAADATLYTPNEVIRWPSRPQRGSSGTRQFRGENPTRDAEIYYSLGRRAQQVKLTISNLLGEELFESDVSRDVGLHLVKWNLSRPNPGSNSRSTAPPGDYLITLLVDGQVHRQALSVVEP